MRVQDGAVAFFIALGMAGVAAGAAYEMHAMLGEYDASGTPQVHPSSPLSPTASEPTATEPTASESTATASTDTGGIDTGNTNAASAAAQSDLSTLGVEFAMYYAGWMEGDPKPVASISNGHYLLNGTDIGKASADVAITGQHANGPDDWCIQVTAAGDAANTFSYSAQSGLKPGAC